MTIKGNMCTIQIRKSSLFYCTLCTALSLFTVVVILRISFVQFYMSWKHQFF